MREMESTKKFFQNLAQLNLFFQIVNDSYIRPLQPGP